MWLAKLFGGEAIKARLSRFGTRAELRVLKKALQESQQRRDELEEAAALFAQVCEDRDRLFAEVIRLRLENRALREERNGGRD